MTDMTMKERLARAILKRRFYDCEPDMYGNDLERFFAEIDTQHMHDARDEAEAVLAELRKSDEYMDYRGSNALVRNGLNYAREDDASECWQAMIDAAISEDKT